MASKEELVAQAEQGTLAAGEDVLRTARPGRKTKPRRKAVAKLPQASHRGTIQVFHAAWEAIRALELGGKYQELPVFTQDWLKQRSITDHGNARAVLSLLELINAEGVLDPRFIEHSRQAVRTQNYEALRGFLRNRLRESLGGQSADCPVPAHLWDSFGQDDFRKESLEPFSALASGQSADRKRKFRTCLEGLLEVIQHCGNQEYFQKAAYPDGRPGLPSFGDRSDAGPQPSPPDPPPGIAATGHPAQSGSPLQPRKFLLTRHKEVKVWFDCAETAENLEQIGLRFLEDADRLRQIEQNLTCATLQRQVTADRKMG